MSRQQAGPSRRPYVAPLPERRPYEPLYSYPEPIEAPPVPRRPNWLARFFQGYFVSLLFGMMLLCGLAAALVLLFPPARTNILILGVDRRPQDASMVTRSDTIILATIKSDVPYVGLLSIPRDLYVTLPSGDQNRINAAHFFAEAETTGTGPAAAMETVRSNFGIDVHRYVRLDLAGFVRIVDALGGIEVNVEAPITDYDYPTYDYGTRFVAFEAGRQHMDGEQALAYARIRHGSSDFQRAERQQVVIQAILERLLQPGAWLRLPSVYAAVNTSIDSDLSLVGLAQLAPTVLRVGPEKLDRGVIEGAMVSDFVTDGGASVQLPVWDRINPLLFEMFGQ